MKFQSIDEYITSLDENGSKAVRGFQDFMISEFPKVAPRICFAMPMWWAGTKMYDGYVAISAEKKHFSIHFHDEGFLSNLSDMLPNCTFGKRCVNIKYDDEKAMMILKQQIIGYFGCLLRTES